MKMRKSQTEIIGLAFVVIIAIFGLIIYVSLTSSIESTDTLRQKQLAASMVTTMIQVDINNIKYQDLVAGCIARAQRCNDLKNYSKEMLSVLDDLNQAYSFTIINPDEVTKIGPLEDPDNPCGITKKAVATQPISLYGTSDKALIMLALC
jgi:hypothetical protein